jgi:hypothetical protein
MYIDHTQPVETDSDPRSPVFARFEAWLRSHGYQPERDPFVPAGACRGETDSAVSLAREYLVDRPWELPNRRELMRHAAGLGEVEALWGDSCGGVIAGFENLDDRDQCSITSCCWTGDKQALVA